MLALVASGLTGLAGCSGQPRERAVPVPEKATHPPIDDPPHPTPEPTTIREPTPDHEAVRWWAEVGDDGPIAPTVVDGTVYVGSTAPVWAKPGTPTWPPHRLFALDLVDGSQRWTLETGPPVDATPVVRDDTVYVVSGLDFGLGGRNYRVDAVDAASGTRQWQFALDESLYLNLLAIAGGSVVLGTNDDQISAGDDEYTYSLDAETGEQRWRAQYADVFFGSAAGPVVYLPAPDGLYAVDSRTGEEWWRFEEQSLLQPVSLGDAVLLRPGDLVSLDATTGDVNWRFGGEEWSVSEWTATSTGVFAATYGGDIYGIDADDGTVRWRYQLSSETWPVAAWRDRVVVGNARGTIITLDGRDGSALWEHRSVEIDEVNDIEVGERNVYVTYDGRSAVVALDAEDGTVRWRFEPGGELTWPVRANGSVLIGSANGFLYALDA